MAGARGKICPEGGLAFLKKAWDGSGLRDDHRWRAGADGASTPALLQRRDIRGFRLWVRGIIKRSGALNHRDIGWFDSVCPLIFLSWGQRRYRRLFCTIHRHRCGRDEDAWRCARHRDQPCGQAELTEKFSTMPPYPEVPGALRRLRDAGFRLFRSAAKRPRGALWGRPNLGGERSVSLGVSNGGHPKEYRDDPAKAGLFLLR